MPWVKVENKEKKKTVRRIYKPFAKVKKNLKTSFLLAEEVLESYRPFFRNSEQLILSAKKGVAKSAIADLAFLCDRNYNDIEALIYTPEKSLGTDYSGLKKLSILQSELLLKLFELYEKGKTIFRDVKNFNNWLQMPAFGLYNKIPNDLLCTLTGINMVIDELKRIESGEFA